MSSARMSNVKWHYVKYGIQIQLHSRTRLRAWLLIHVVLRILSQLTIVFLYKLNTSNWMNWLNWLNWLKWLDAPSQYRVTPIFHGSGVLSGCQGRPSMSMSMGREGRRVKPKHIGQSISKHWPDPITPSADSRSTATLVLRNS